jgi:hypothetical protein
LDRRVDVFTIADMCARELLRVRVRLGDVDGAAGTDFFAADQQRDLDGRAALGRDRGLQFGAFR